MTLPLIPGVRPDPEPGDRDASYKRHLNAVLDLLDRVEGRALTNASMDLALGWRAGTASQWTWQMIARGDLISTERAGRYKLYRRPPLSDGGP